MNLEVAIIADDLTGALDTSTPFVAAGYRVAVATKPAGLRTALESGAEVVAVCTASRALPPDLAARAVTEAATLFKTRRPTLVFKKIDSRLKGNVGAETAALVRSFGLADALVAPAVPTQGRFTDGDAVTGRGVQMPIPIAPAFVGLTFTIANATCDADLDAAIAAIDWSRTLAVGASGLGAALARRRPPVPAATFEPEQRTLFAIGSRDGITAGQIAALSGIGVHDAPLGSLDEGPMPLPAVIRCSGDYAGDDEAVAKRFAESIARMVDRLQPRALVMSGGDTALALLERLGVQLVFPQGEAEPGLPWFLIERENRPNIVAVVKSGGFGDSSSLAALLPRHDSR